jgi:preprotein translocase subunit YajC
MWPLIESAYGMASPQNGTGEGPGLFASMIPLVLIFGVFYFLLVRPQKKQMEKQKQFLNQLEKGTDVVTSSGIYGKVVGVADNVVTLEIADKIKIKVAKSHISGLVPVANNASTSTTTSNLSVAAEK